MLQRLYRLVESYDSDPTLWSRFCKDENDHEKLFSPKKITKLS